jgi:hypothetical protein
MRLKESFVIRPNGFLGKVQTSCQAGTGVTALHQLVSWNHLLAMMVMTKVINFEKPLFGEETWSLTEGPGCRLSVGGIIGQRLAACN